MGQQRPVGAQFPICQNTIRNGGVNQMPAPVHEVGSAHHGQQARSTQLTCVCKTETPISEPGTHEYSERLSSVYATGACYSWNIFQAGLLNPSGSKVISVFLFWRCTMDTTWTRDTKSNSHINVTPKLDRVRSPAWNMFDVACSHATYFEMGF